MHRPTTLRYAAENCLHAVTLYEKGVEPDPDLYALGTASHEVLHALGEGRDPNAVAERLISVGRSGDDATPPLPPNLVFAGRDLAYRFAERHPLASVEDGASYETRFAFDASWEPTSWEGAYFRTRLDVVLDTVEGEDEFGLRVITVRDYKSSWAVDEDVFSDGIPLQQRAQAVAAWLTYPDADVIRIELASLRRRWVYSHDLPLDENGIATLEGWRDDLSILARAVDSGRLPAPGGGCHGCTFARSCEPLKTFLDDETDETIVRRYVAARGLVSSLEPLARGFLAKGESITVDGTEVGYIESKTSVPRPGSALSAFGRFALKIGFTPNDDTMSALHAFFDEVEPGKSWFESIAKKLFIPRKEATERKDWLSEKIEARVSPRWNVKRPKA